MSHTSTLSQQNYWNNRWNEWKLPFYFSKPALHHIKHFVDGMLSTGYTGTLTDIHRESLQERDRRTLSHFLTHGNWEASYLEHIVQRAAFQQIQAFARRERSPMFVILDDTVCEKTKPSSQATHPIQGASFQYSHLQRRHVYGHAVVQTLLRSGDHVFPFATARYDPQGKSKIELAGDMIRAVPLSSCQTYVLMDSWYPSASILQTCAERGFHVISGLKTNRIFYPQGIRQSLQSFASYISKTDTDLVTIGSSTYRVYRYEGKLNLVENAVLLLCWTEGEGFDPKQMKAFLRTDVSLNNEEILSYYSKRWAIETYFRTAKVQLAMDRYQVRSAQAIDRYLTLLMFAALCCAYRSRGNLIDGLHRYRIQKKHDMIEFIYNQAQRGATLEQIKTRLRVA
ncbi:transposase [Paenibacillus silvae]|uniref:Transposase n=1 Tax=Paenibacillus silvae TaxID=1325358 RepID=A0ABQ1Z3I7_9BACL|nr:IS701 family transposase [Paenibacillus silvae]GGH46486.1 transposase [Paenibacillus silvae]